MLLLGRSRPSARWCSDDERKEAKAKVDAEVEDLVKALHEKVGRKQQQQQQQQQKRHSREPHAGASGSPKLSRNLKEAFSSLNAFARESSPEELKLRGLNSYERRRVHQEARGKGLESASDDDKVVIVRRGGVAPQKLAEARFDKKPSSTADDKPSGDRKRSDAPPKSGESKPSTSSAAPAAGGTAATSPLPDSPTELMARIDKLSAALREQYARLRELRADPATRPVELNDVGTVPPETVLEIDGAEVGADANGVAIAPNLGEPIGAQEINYDSAHELLKRVQPVTKVERHIAIATVVGRIAEVPESCAEEEGGEQFVRAVLLVESPIISDPAERTMRLEVRAYCPVLGRFFGQHTRQGDVVHVLGHMLPHGVDGSPVIVLIGDGCHVSLIYAGG